ncbi:MAG: DUF3793 family protein [Clostridiales bacterium]|nr:DUF3793 family protein [Clostridiales bacterium]
MLDRAIIDHASPTLARLKLGNLFTFRIDEDFFGEYAALCSLLGPKGVSLTILRIMNGKALIYIYRRDELDQALSRNDIRGLLADFGYTRFDADGAIDMLRRRLGQADGFPHEIGVFLGYPIEDVRGFIENGGRNCLTCGYWKVYSDECAALTAFARYEKCKAVYQRLFASGCPLSRLTVAARGA